jgi:formamidopyrimidine-DNA glycosylase
MPELPEVETMRRGILGVVGSTIAYAGSADCKLKPISIKPRLPAFRRRAVGRRITAVDRVGKRVIVRLDSGDAIVFEPRMTGLVLVADPPNEEHLRFRLMLSGGNKKQLLFWDRRGLGSVRLLSPREFDKQLGEEKLGPDALLLTPETLRARLCESRRAVKVALLDQRAVAGIGNLYASEILHLAGVHPKRRCDRLTRQQWQRIHEAMIDVLETAIRYEGSTLSDGTYRNALNSPGGYQNQHRVYDRAGQLCPTCREQTVQRIVQAQRSTFFCRHCQPANGRR